MSHLKLYVPPQSESPSYTNRIETTVEEDAPRILPFQQAGTLSNTHQVMDSITRARLLHENRSCPCCDHPVVELIELNDALMTRNQLPIPGTATLVGFRCESCLNEWPV